MELSKSAGSIKHSAIRRMFNKALQYDHVISFTLGEPDFTASENVVEAGCKAIREGKTKYSANAGIMPLREAVASSLKKDTGLEYDPEKEITITTGGMGALFLTLKSLVDPGDEVIICEPYWTNYVQQVQLCGGLPVFVVCKEENDFMLDLQDLESAITDKTKVLILNSPSNPTGAVLDENTLKGIADIAKSHDLLVISDEVYKTIVYDGLEYKSISEFPDMKERTIVVNSFSKGYAMTGWRVGYAAGPEWIIDCVTKLQEDVAACAAMPCQYAALEALTGSQEFNRFMVEKYAERRAVMIEKLNSIAGISCKAPKGTFYAFANIKALGMKSQEFADALLEEKQVVVVPGTAFGEGGEGYIRLSYATDMDHIIQGLEKISEFAEELLNKRD